jgi:hypothetical protein
VTHPFSASSIEGENADRLLPFPELRNGESTLAANDAFGIILAFSHCSWLPSGISSKYNNKSSLTTLLYSVCLEVEFSTLSNKPASEEGNV